VVPVVADLFSLQGLRNLGPTLKTWRQDWTQRISGWTEFATPQAIMQPLGYILLQHAERLHRPVKAYNQWAARLPEEYRQYLGTLPVAEIARIRNFRSLMPYGQEARKPVFELSAAEGAAGANAKVVRDAYGVFETATSEILHRMGFNL
jgi:chromosome partitioning protein